MRASVVNGSYVRAVSKKPGRVAPGRALPATLLSAYKAVRFGLDGARTCNMVTDRPPVLRSPRLLLNP